MKLNRGTSGSMVIARIGAVVLIGGLLLSGCAAETSDTEETDPPDATATQDASPAATTDEPEVEEPAEEEVDAEETDGEANESEDEGPAPATATFTLADESFTFSPSTCMIWDEDLSVEAAGENDATGDIAFLFIDVSFGDNPTGEVRVELGSDNPFEPGESSYEVSFESQDSPEVTAEFPQAAVTGIFHQDTGEVVGEGKIDVTCG